MCEFCSQGLKSNNGTHRDASDPSFSGFFSPDAIERVVRQANETRQTNRTQRKKDTSRNDHIRNDCCDSLASSASSSEDEDGGDEDDDGT
mmetsp:Transcript_5608/g.8624  ORF Transcript_5608/g.8624 Transcript_5608/m.8624 type:complete len:90 (-) Transcript_5608:1576-1845(-)